MISLWKYHKISILFIVLSALFYGTFAYQLDRSDFPKLIGLYFALFFVAYQLFKIIGGEFKTILLLGLLFRLVFIIAIPNLSQDFYRFIWDGYLNLSGSSPYLFTPNELMATGTSTIPNAEVLYANMGALSASNYSNYPPVNQFCFAVANLVPGSSILSSVIGLRILIILADLGILYIGVKLLKLLKLPVSNIFWYFLNPFIIIELTGNLHFEGVMLFFMVVSLHLLAKKRYAWSAVCLALSISVKLIPLMLLPLFFSYFTKGWSKAHSEWKNPNNYKVLFFFYMITSLVVALTFLPFISEELIEHYSATVGLWFTKFEFNASIYYLARGIGYAITGYNEIAIIGKILPILSVVFIGYRSVFRDNSDIKKLVQSMLFVVSIYLLLSTTVHPWYVVSLVVFSPFTSYKYPVIWSLVVVLSYYAYGQADFKENYWLLSVEYGVVLWLATKELFMTKEPKLG